MDFETDLRRSLPKALKKLSHRLSNEVSIYLLGRSLFVIGALLVRILFEYSRTNGHPVPGIGPC